MLRRSRPVLLRRIQASTTSKSEHQPRSIKGRHWWSSTPFQPAVWQPARTLRSVFDPWSAATPAAGFAFSLPGAFPTLPGMSGIIAIVGRPNVGKSALFNRIAGRRIAIVHDQPGVTRDRVTAELEWVGRPFSLIDTGGIGAMRGEKSADVITRAAYDQVQIAIDSANVILFDVNVQAPAARRTGAAPAARA